MFAWRNATWDTATTQNHDDTSLPRLDARTTGIIAGTKVATKAGWVPIETIHTGQQVLTFDGGLQTVVAITRHRLLADKTDNASWPLSVPVGALGNRDVMTILPHQSVLIESDAAEDLTGDPFALIPGAALMGLRGITQLRPSDWVDVFQLHFSQDEIVFANIGALFLCRAQADLVSDMGASTYDVLPMDAAKDLVDCLMFEDEARTPNFATSTSFCAAA
ncbi:MAG: Hint domain-containing protein [Octadecabacter sp.]